MSAAAAQLWRIGPDRATTLDRPIIMGVLNVTPDSFSDGGLHVDVDAAVDAALRMIDEGAAIIDVGGESTRPGAQRIGAAEQKRRVLPVIERIRRRLHQSPSPSARGVGMSGLRASDAPGAPTPGPSPNGRGEFAISIDTTLSEVAEAALDAGANIINDVAAGTEDDRIIELAAKRGCGLILMHRLRPPQQDSYSTQYAADAQPHYADVVEVVARFLDQRASEAIRAGVDPSQIVLDPGLGFGKTVSQNYALIARIDEIAALRYPVLCAASRKSFLDPGKSSEPRDRLAASIAAAVAMHHRGVRLFRVHDVAPHRQALAASTAVEAAATHNPPNPLRS